MTAARSFPLSMLLVERSILIVWTEPWSATLLMSTVEKASRLSSRKSQMTIKMLRFMKVSQSWEWPW